MEPFRSFSSRMDNRILSVICERRSVYDSCNQLRRTRTGTNRIWLGGRVASIDTYSPRAARVRRLHRHRCNMADSFFLLCLRVGSALSSEPILLNPCGCELDEHADNLDACWLLDAFPRNRLAQFLLSIDHQTDRSLSRFDNKHGLDISAPPRCSHLRLYGWLQLHDVCSRVKHFDFASLAHMRGSAAT